MSKNIELLDTIFIIVRQKGSQLSFLHIYHHSTMSLVWWVGAKFVPGGSALNVALVNCVVHVLMYAYYAFATLGQRVRAYLWWKKYLTMLQLVSLFWRNDKRVMFIDDVTFYLRIFCEI